MFSSLETNLKTEIDPLLKLVNLLPTDDPPIKPVVQGGDKGVGSSKDPDQGKVVRKVISTKIPKSLPTSLSTTSTTMTSKPLTKGIVTGSTVGGSSSKPPPSKKVKCDRGNGIKKEISEEEECREINRKIMTD